jgi:DNA-binding IclR family transcriptional regulator
MVVERTPTAGESPDAKRSGRIQSVDRAAGILRALATGTPTLGVTEIADRINLAKPTVHGLLRTLESNGLVRQDPDTGKYSLGPAVLKLGNAYLAGSELRSRSMLRAAALARQVNEAVWVGVLTEADIMVVHHEFRPDDVVQILEVGASIPWHACALGHAMAAYADSETLATLMTVPLRPLTGRTRTTKAALSRALVKVRADGYAIENQELNVGDGGIAAPIFDRRGGVAGSVGVVGPAERLLSPAGRVALARGVVETARAISRDLSGRLVGIAGGNE